jgi:hypothetical protein
VNGYFAAGSSLAPLVPARLLESPVGGESVRWMGQFAMGLGCVGLGR